MCETEIQGVHLFESNAHIDNRGSWLRIFDRSWACPKAEGLGPFVQISISTNPIFGTFRGLHFLQEKALEWKLVSCAAGAVQDILIDMREESPTKGAIMSLELSHSGTQSLLIPPGVAHGFLTLEQNCVLVYAMTAPYDPNLDMGVSILSDELMGRLLFAPKLISLRDQSLPVLGSNRGVNG